MLNIGVLVSGGGTNLQALIDAVDDGRITNGKIVTVLSNREGAYALKRAEQAKIPTKVLVSKQYADRADFERDVVAHMKANGVELIVMAGFMCIMGETLLSAYQNKIINVHPSLIPSFCGDGYYGLHVHEAALARGVKVTGATVHFVNEITDGGPIILQKSVDILDSDTPEILQKRVMEEAEWMILPKAVDLICNNKIKIIDNIVREA